MVHGSFTLRQLYHLPCIAIIKYLATKPALASPFLPTTTMIVLSSLSFILLAASRVSALWPLPQTVSSGSSPLTLSSSFDITLDGIDTPPQDLTDAISRTKGYLVQDQLEILTPDRGASNADVISGAPALESLVLSVTGEIKSISEEATAPLESRVENYTLSIPSDGSAATLTAQTTLGLLRGLTTFSQVWYATAGSIYTVEAPFDIEDSPAYVRSPYAAIIPLLNTTCF